MLIIVFFKASSTRGWAGNTRNGAKTSSAQRRRQGPQGLSANQVLRQTRYRYQQSPDPIMVVKTSQIHMKRPVEISTENDYPELMKKKSDYITTRTLNLLYKL